MASLDERVEALEMRVGNLETWSGPGQAEALVQGQQELRAQLRRVEHVQERHTRMLAGLKTDVAGLKTDVAGLKTDVAGLKTDVAGLKTDVAGLKTDVAGLKTDVAGLKADMGEVKDTLREVLRRLPPPPAG